MIKKLRSMLLIFAPISLNLAVASVDDLQTEFPLIDKTLDPPGVCTFYNPKYCSPFTQEKYEMSRPLEQYIDYAPVNKVTLAELVDLAEKDVVPEYHIEGLIGDDGFFNKEHFDANAQGWEGTCHKWCAWQSSKTAVKHSFESEGHVCGKYFLSKGDVSEFFTAIYPTTTKDANGEYNFFGTRTNPYYRPKDWKNSKDVERARIVNLAMMTILDKAGFQNFWPHEADKTYEKYIIKQGRVVTTNVDAHTPNVWNQPTFHFQRLVNSDLTEDLPLLSIFDEKWNYWGPTYFYEGTPSAIDDLNKLEDIEYTLMQLFVVLSKNEHLHADLSDKVYPLILKDSKTAKSMKAEILSFIKEFEKNNKHNYMDVVNELYRQKIELFQKAKPYLRLKEQFSGIFVKANIKYLQECRYRAATNFVREANYDYYIIKDEKKGTLISKWANSQMVDKARPDFIAVSTCVDDECRKKVEDAAKLQEISKKSVDEKLKQADEIYSFATGAFLKLLERCVKVSDIKVAIRQYEERKNIVQRELNVLHSSAIPEQKKNFLKKEYQILKEGPIIPGNSIKLKGPFKIMPEHRIGGIIEDKDLGLVFVDFNSQTGNCQDEKGRNYLMTNCFISDASILTYSKDDSRCDESRKLTTGKFEYLRTVPFHSCAIFGAKPNKHHHITPPVVAPMPTPLPAPAEPTPVILTARERIANELKSWQNSSISNPQSIDRESMRQSTKRIVMQLAQYDAINGTTVRYPNFTPMGLQNGKIISIWYHLEKNIYRWAARKYEIEKEMKKMMTKALSAKEVEKLGKPLIKELCELNMKLVLRENVNFALPPSIVRYPSGSAGDMWKYLNESYYRKKWSRSKYLYYAHNGF